MSYNLNEEQFNKIKQDNQGLTLFKKISADLITPTLSLVKLSKYFDSNIFLFESVEKGSNKGRFSVIGFDPDQIWQCQNGQSSINKNFSYNQKDFSLQHGEILENLRKFITEAQINNDPTWNLPAMSSGIFGYMGYDMIQYMEDISQNNKPDTINIPDSIFIRPQVIIIFDNLFDLAIICAPCFKNDNKEYQELCYKIDKTIHILRSEIALDKKEKLNTKFNFISNCTKQEYCQMVEKSKEYIKDGDIFQVLPSQRFSADFPSHISEFDFYRSLRSINPSPFLFYLQFEDFVISGSSPEIMASAKNKIVTVRPLAGTRKRGNNKIEDEKISQELLKDEKEIAEHLMLIDLGRHDVGRVSKEASVKVTEKMTIEYYSHVMHISSNVEGILKDNCDALDVLISSFPAGTVSGAPKIRAMEIIYEIEKEKRSFYAGCVGYFASNGDMETCITLRSALIKDKKIYLQSGAGVVYDSKADLEYEECLNKAQALIKACHNIDSID